MSERLESAPAFPELEFDEGPHLYRLDGETIPSVSQIITPLNQAKYEGISRKVLDKAADRGTAVHNAIENWLKFDIVDIPSEHMGYMDAFRDWWDTTKPVVVGSEVKVYHKLQKYAGTVDLLCYIGDDLVLIDYKTTAQVSEMTCGVQLEGYAQALKSHGVVVGQKRILHIRKDGKWKEYGFPANDARCWRVFGACKTVYDYLESYK